MGDSTGIAWTERTWSPWQGCHKVSPGCAHCYMYRDKLRYGQDPGTVVRSSPSTFNRPLSKAWATPSRVFCCSWSDFFIEGADPWRAEAWEIIRRTPHLTYQIPTKRIERARDCLPTDWGDGWSNVWLGVTAEDQRAADERIPELLATPAAVRWVSVEPMIGPVDLAPAIGAHGYVSVSSLRLDWVVVGSESGPGARAMDEAWVRGMRDQCTSAGVPFFFKQRIKNGRKVSTPDLDGRRWMEYPHVA